MARLSLLLLAAFFVAAPAHAAIASKSERGVRVWRPGPPAAVDAPSLKGEANRACAHRTLIVVVADEQPWRLRTHGFWSGDRLSWEARLPLTTQGFFADRIAAGL